MARKEKLYHQGNEKNIWEEVNMEDEGGMTNVHDVIVLKCLYKAYRMYS